MDFIYTTSKALRDREFIASGKSVSPITHVSVDPENLSPRARMGITCVRKLETRNSNECTLPGKLNIPGHSAWARVSADTYEANTLLDAGSVNDILEKFADVYDAATADIIQWTLDEKEYKNSIARQRAEDIAKQQARVAADKVQEEAKRQERLRLTQEKETWISQNGSEHLRRATSQGFDCQRLYVTERATVEYPGFGVDFKNGLEWKSRSCPSEAALDLMETLPGTTIVWVTYDGSGDEFTPCEAVVVENFLGAYTLYKYT